ncbi:MAG: D-2-hydroxyacid dehydrogenase [Candidatus Asgardarchaeia archaeon]
MTRILVADKVDENELKRLEREGFEVDRRFDIQYEELKNVIKEYDAIIVRSRTKVTKEIIDAAPKLKLIARPGVGLDNIDVEYAKKKGIEVVNSPEAPTRSVAELVIALIFSLYRKIPIADRKMKNGIWAKKELVGHELKGKTIGIIGCGRIGREVGRLAHALGLNVIGYDIYEIPEKVIKELDMKVVSNLKDLLKESDIVTLHVPLTNNTKGMIGKEELQLMKRTAIIINTSRGGIVKESDLLEALKNGTIAGAGLDVYSEEPPKSDLLKELISLDNVVATPHIGATTEEAIKANTRIVVDKIISFFKK